MLVKIQGSMGTHRTFLHFLLLVYLIICVSGKRSPTLFHKARRKIFKLCSDVTASNELQLSYECAQQMKLSSPGAVHMKSRRFMAVRFHIFTNIIFLF